MTITLDDLNKPADEALLHGEDASQDVQNVEQGQEQEKSDLEVESLQEVEAKADVKEKKQEDKQKNHDGFVPQARLSEVIAERNAERERIKELEAKLAELSAANEQKPLAESKTTDINAQILELQRKEKEAFLEGDDAEYDRLRAEINSLIEKRTIELVRNEQKAVREKESAENLFANAIAVAVEAYPQLDSNNKNADNAAINAVIKMRDANVTMGMPIHEALLAAVRDVAELRGWSNSTEEKQTTIKDDRKQQALKTAIDTNSKQPSSPSDGGVGNRALSNVVDLKNLSQKEYEKLPEKERQALLA